MEKADSGIQKFENSRWQSSQCGVAVEAVVGTVETFHVSPAHPRIIVADGRCFSTHVFMVSAK
jgi:hypothetical protein